MNRGSNATAEQVPTPPAVTFATGAKLLVDLGIAPTMSRQRVRFIADNAEDWPFGPGREHPYWRAGKALLMATEPFLDYFRRRASKEADAADP